MNLGASDVLHTNIGELNSKKVAKMKNRFNQMQRKQQTVRTSTNVETRITLGPTADGDIIQTENTKRLAGRAS